MSGGGKGQETPKLPHYMMTVHFGICHGPIDSINKLWVKEKEIWCGNVTEDDFVFVHLPELFGGEQSEGGVSGVVECYMGGWEQRMTKTAASRYNKVPSEMPGYRGIANLMFRGYERNEIEHRPSGSGGGSTPVLGLDIVDDILGGIFDDPAGGPVESSGGWEWQTNNPYMPGAWAHVTRIGRALSSQWAEVYPSASDNLSTYSGTKFATAYNHGGAGSSSPVTTIDLTPYRKQIDAGQATFDLSLTYKMESGWIPPEDRLALVGVHVEFYNENGGQGNIDQNLYDPGRDEYFGSGGSRSVSYPVPPNARKAIIWGNVTEVTPMFERAYVTSQEWKLTYPETGRKFCKRNGDPGQRPDMNPAHIIYECLTNSDWGMGDPPEAIDTDSFMEAAETLFNEGFGLSMTWFAQMEIRNFINEVIDHIQAALFLDPGTGLWTLKLIRGDYDPATLPILDPSNCTATNRQRKLLGETINEIVINWTNPNTEKEEAITFHDLGNIAAQGCIVSDTRNYYGVRSPGLANRLGARDIRAAAYPLFSCEIEADRSFRFLRPGSVVRLNWPEDGIANMVVRVGKIDPGKRRDSKIKMEVTEDVYALETTEYEIVTETGWQSPDDSILTLTQRSIITPPLPMMVRSGLVDLETDSDASYPEVPAVILGYGPSVATVELYADTVNPTGITEEAKIGEVYATPGAATAAVLPREAISTMTFAEVQGIARRETPQVGDFLMIGSTDESSEIIMLERYVAEAKYWIVQRGMFDTAPRQWPAGTWAWYIGRALSSLYPASAAAEDELAVKMVPRSSARIVDPATITPTVEELSSRPYRPHRPANIQAVPVGGVPEVTLYPQSIVNGGAENGTAGWTVSNVLTQGAQTVTGLTTVTINPRSGGGLFKVDEGDLTGWMEQKLSLPYRARLLAEDPANNLVFCLRWFQAHHFNEDTCKAVITFYAEDDATVLGTFETDALVAGIEAWAYRRVAALIPQGTFHLKVRFELALTAGMSVNCYLDDISSSWGEAEWTYLYVGAEIPTSFELSWANRNRLLEDAIPPKWSDGNVTPEVGQTTTIRVEDDETGAVLTEVTGLVGTSYTLPMPALLNGVNYRVSLYAARDGFDSIQAGYFLLETTALGWDAIWDYDWDENDG